MVKRNNGILCWKFEQNYLRTVSKYLSNTQNPCLEVSEIILIRTFLLPDDELYKQAFICSHPGPDIYDLNFFRDWFASSTEGKYPLRGIDRHAWSPTYDDDFIALKRREPVDPFSKWFTTTVVPKFHSLIGHRITVRCGLPSLLP
jgi:hypothetical protein